MVTCLLEKREREREREREKKQKKEPCPKCGKLFERLDTHLRNNAVCQTTSHGLLSHLSLKHLQYHKRRKMLPANPLLAPSPHAPLVCLSTTLPQWISFPQLTCQKKQVSGKKQTAFSRCIWCQEFAWKRQSMP